VLPDPLLERLHAGDDPDHQALAARASPADTRRLQELASSDAEILARYPVRAVMAELERRARRRRRRRLGWLASAGAIAAVLLAVALQPAPPEVRAKGDPVLSVLVEGQRQPLQSGAIGDEGDRLQLVLDPSGARHAVVVSVDGRGVVTVHFPRTGGDTRLPGGGAVPLDSSFRLDDAPSYEVFYAVTSQGPLDVDRIVSAAAAGGPDEDLAVPEPQARFHLRKAP
jgi:hypothetical protein